MYLTFIFFFFAAFYVLTTLLIKVGFPPWCSLNRMGTLPRKCFASGLRTFCIQTILDPILFAMLDVYVE